jgi:EAL domain-containing protein (putative c-di-GMP-specific phosphodiesterase class I)
MVALLGRAGDGDFGTGWSSLALLAQIPFSRMKIDARFVLSAPSDDTAMGIVESSVHLGRRPGMTIVADGIETQAHRDLCARFGIDAAQGFMPGRPAPAGAFAARYLRA